MSPWRLGFRVVWEGIRKSTGRGPLGVCGYSHFIKLGKSRGLPFYHVLPCYQDAYHRLDNDQLRCPRHIVFPSSTFDEEEFN